jgi:hypothetical protein
MSLRRHGWRESTITYTMQRRYYNLYDAFVVVGGGMGGMDLSSMMGGMGGMGGMGMDGPDSDDDDDGNLHLCLSLSKCAQQACM